MTDCIRCGRPMADQAYADTHCTDRAAGQLRNIADMTPAARAEAQGLASHSGGGSTGKPGSRLPFDLGATARLDAVQGELATLARQIGEQRGRAVPLTLPRRGPVCPVCEHESCAAIREREPVDVIAAAALWLPAHLEWLRHRQEVDEALDTIEACARVVTGIARGPAAQKYLGPCGATLGDDVTTVDPEHGEGIRTYVERECEGDIYAREGASAGRCRTCGAEVSTDARRAWLDAEARSHAYTAAEIAAAYPIRANTIRQWLSRGLLVQHGELDGRPLLLLGDVLDLAAGDAARRETARAERARRKEASAA